MTGMNFQIKVIADFLGTREVRRHLPAFTCAQEYNLRPAFARFDAGSQDFFPTVK